MLMTTFTNNDYAVKKLYSEGKIEEANSRLGRMVDKITREFQV